MPPHVDATLNLWAARTLGWLLTYGVHSTLLLGLVWLVARHRHVGDAARDALWKLGMIGGLVTATIQVSFTREPLGGQMRLFAPPSLETVRMLGMRMLREREAMRTAMGNGGLQKAELQVVRREGALIVRDTVVARGGVGAGGVMRFDAGRDRIFIRRTPTAPWPEILAGAWLVIAIGALATLAVAHARLARRLSGRRRLPAGSPIAARLEALRARTALRRSLTVSQCDALSSPVALPRGEICLPPRALRELDEAQLDSILAHEIAHLERRDPYWLLAARLLEATLFFQPLNRLARRHLQETAEYLCDAWAVRRTGRPLSLARCLAAVAEWVGPQASAQPVAAMVERGGSPLIRRVRRILEPAPAPRTRGATPVLALGIVTLGVLACAAPRVAVFPTRLPSARTTVFVQRLGNADSTFTRGAPRVAPAGAREAITFDYVTHDSLQVIIGAAGDTMAPARVNVLLRQTREAMQLRERRAAELSRGGVRAGLVPPNTGPSAGPLPRLAPTVTRVVNPTQK